VIRPARTSPALLGAGLATIYVVWGTTYLGIRVGVETIPPFLLSGVRYVLAGLLLFGWVALRGGLSAGWPTRRQWLSAVLTGTGLVAFGNGLINAFNPTTLSFEGAVRAPGGRPVTIDGLWALLPGNGTSAGTDDVWFSAGPQEESHGLLGVLRARPDDDDR